VLSDWQITIPEIGTLTATHIPYVITTSNRIRELSDALRRRCLYLWIDYPSFEKELSIVRRKVQGIDEHLAIQITSFVQAIRHRKLARLPGIAETLDWAASLVSLHRTHLDAAIIEETSGVLFKSREDTLKVKTELLPGLLQSIENAP